MCSDPEQVFYPQRHICYAEMEQAAAQRSYKELHEARPWHNGTFKAWSAEQSAAFPYHVDDGVTITVATEDLAPEDKFLTPPMMSADAAEPG